MKVPFLDLSEQYKQLEQEITIALQQVFTAARFILGPQLELFENEFANYIGTKYAVGVNSGTDALALSLMALGVRADDEVITVPNTAIPTVSAIRMAHAKPVFVDIDEKTQLMNPELLEERITNKTKGIIPVHLFGQCCDMQKILDIATKKNLFVLEDACQAHGSTYAGKKAGSIGIAGCFSFYPSKNLGAYGDGGMITTNDESLAKKLKMMRNYGQPKRYVCDCEGINSRLDEVQAAVLRIKLAYLDSWNEKRRENAQQYKVLIRTDKIMMPHECEDRTHNYHLFTVQSKERDSLKKYLECNGVGTEVHYPIPIYLQKGYAFLSIKKGECPVSERCMNEILSLPIYPELTKEQITYVAEQINKFYE